MTEWMQFIDQTKATPFIFYNFLLSVDRVWQSQESSLVNCEVNFLPFQFAYPLFMWVFFTANFIFLPVEGGGEQNFYNYLAF